MKVGRESDVRWRRVGDVELGHRAQQEFARGMHRHVALSRVPVTGHCYRVQSQGTGTGHRHGSLIRKSLPRLNVTVAHKQRHPG